MNESVKHPAHCTSDAKCSCGKPIECIQVTSHMNFNVSNTVKYLWRHKAKSKPIEDLEKARQYIEFEIERLKQQPERKKRTKLERYTEPEQETKYMESEMK